MGQLFEISKKIDDVISQKKMDRLTTRGKIGLKSGVLMAFTEQTPDDAVKSQKIKAAAREILGVDL